MEPITAIKKTDQVKSLKSSSKATNIDVNHKLSTKSADDKVLFQV